MPPAHTFDDNKVLTTTLDFSSSLQTSGETLGTFSNKGHCSSESFKNSGP